MRYGANNYGFEYQIRRAKKKQMPIKHVDGKVAHNYAVVCVPEDPSVPSACYIEKTAVSVEDAFSTTEGGTDLYTHDAIKPDDNSRMVKWGKIAVSKNNNGEITSIIAEGEDFGEEPVTIYSAALVG